VAVKIKLMRLGKIRQPYYRIVIADARTRRNGKAIEAIGKYHPKVEPSFIEVDSDRVQYWLGVGAKPTEPVQRILEITGDWQRFTGQPGTDGTLRRAEPKPDKAELFAKALAEAGEAPTTEATTPKKRGARKAADPVPDTPAATSAGSGEDTAKAASSSDRQA
jgi:small subunit ribosomal protein S16